MKNQLMSFVLTRELKQTLESASKKTGTSQAEFLRQILHEYFSRRGFLPKAETYDSVEVRPE